MTDFDPTRIVLGQQVDHSPRYDPSQLCPIPRHLGRTAAGLDEPAFPFGEDIWNMYELSWLTPTERPVAAMAEARIPWDSPCLIESKSLKLYCNSFNMSRFESADAVRAAMERDLSQAAGAAVRIALIPAARFSEVVVAEPDGICVDEADTDGFSADVDPTALRTDADEVCETLFSRLFRSRCPVTAQPDWATLCVNYAGPRIPPGSLLRYVVSFREHQGFHEACVERIFADIQTRCQPRELTVSARFTRRGGIDINPVRSTRPGPWPNIRDPRQ